MSRDGDEVVVDADEAIAAAEAETPAPVAVPPKRRVEEIGLERGMLPQLLEGPKPPGKPKAIVQPVPNDKFPPLARTMAGKGWRLDTMVTESEFDAALEETEKHVYR